MSCVLSRGSVPAAELTYCLVLTPGNTANSTSTGCLFADFSEGSTENVSRSAIAHPDHNEVLEVDPLIPEEQAAVYTVRGYAYAGGGRRINRVELSFDEGDSWKLADMYVSHRSSHGKSSC